MSAELKTPTVRVCEQCGREERWDDGAGSWRIARRDGRKETGRPHCIHEWDINGTFNPLNGH